MQDHPQREELLNLWKESTANLPLKVYNFRWRNRRFIRKTIGIGPSYRSCRTFKRRVQSMPNFTHPYSYEDFKVCTCPTSMTSSGCDWATQIRCIVDEERFWQQIPYSEGLLKASLILSVVNLQLVILDRWDLYLVRCLRDELFQGVPEAPKTNARRLTT